MSKSTACEAISETALEVIHEVTVQVVSEEEKAKQKAHKEQLEGLAFYKINQMFGAMISQNVFYARVMASFVREPSWDKGLTIGMKLMNGRLVFRYHPEYVHAAGHIELIDRIEHECVHILNNHMSRSMKLLQATSIAELKRKLREPKTSAMVNLSTDFSANYELYANKNNNRPMEGTWPMANDAPFGLDLNQAIETYYGKLRQSMPPDMEQMPDYSPSPNSSNGSDSKENQKGKPSQGKSPMSDLLENLEAQHDWFDKDYDEAESQSLFCELDNQVDGAIRRAEIDQARNRGTVPERYQEMIRLRNQKPKVPWNKLLRSKVSNSLLSDKDANYVRPQRQRLAIDPTGKNISLFPSRKKRPGYTIVFAIDTSGSMSQDDLKLAAQELLTLSNQFPGSRVIVINCDAIIEHEYVLETTDQIGKRREAVGRLFGGGGTSFEPPLKRALYGPKAPKEIFGNMEVFESRVKDFPSKIDAFIYCTDGYAPVPAKSLSPKCNVFWVVVPNGTREVGSNFGQVIQMDGPDE